MQDQDPWELNYAPAAAAPPLTTGYTVKGLTGTEPKVQLRPISGTNTSVAAEVDPWEKDYQRPQTPAPSMFDEAVRMAKIGATASGLKMGKDIVAGGGKAAMDFIVGNPVNPQDVQQFKSGAGTLIGGIRDEPARVWQELVKSGEAMTRGDLNAAADHLWFSVPIAGGAGAGMAEYLNRGDIKGALAHAFGSLLPFAHEPAIGAIKALPEAAETTGAAASGAAKGGWKGASGPTVLPIKIKGVQVAEIPGVPASVAGAVTGGGVGTLFGGPKGGIVGAVGGAAAPFVRGAIKGGRAAVADLRTARAAAASAEEAAAAPAAEAAAAAPAGAPTDEALVHLYSVETDPAKRSALRAELVNRGVMNEPGTATPAPEANPYRTYTQSALQRVYGLEQDPAKRALIEQAASDRNLTLLNREGRRATAAVPETGAPEAPGPSLTQDDALMLQFLGTKDPLTASAADIATARKLAADNPELLRRLRAGGEGEAAQPPTAQPAAESFKPGDTVQWQSQGVDQFQEPRRIRGLSPDGNYAFVEGTNTGIPVDQLTRQTPAAPAAEPSLADQELERATRPGLAGPRVMSPADAAQAFPGVYGQPPAAGQVFAESQGLEWAKLSASDRQSLEHVAQAQANVAAQPPPLAQPQTAGEFMRGEQPVAQPQTASEFMRGEQPNGLEQQLAESIAKANAAKAAKQAAQPENIYVKNARLAKAVRVADAAAEQGMTSADVYKLKPDEFARKVGEKSISDDTMAMVVDKLRRREADLERAGPVSTAAAKAPPKATFKVAQDPAEPGLWSVEVKTGDQRIGTMELIEHPNALEVDLSHVTPKYRGQGYGKAMYQEAINQARQLGKRYLISGSEFTEDAARVWRSLGGEQFTDAAGEPRWRLLVEPPDLATPSKLKGPKARPPITDFNHP